MATIQIRDFQSRFWLPGLEGFLSRLSSLIERGRIDVSEIRLSDLVRWLFHSPAIESGPSRTIAEICAALEGAARLALLKARQLNGMWEVAIEDEDVLWPGQPAELAPRRSWLAARLADAPWSFAGPSRSHEGALPILSPIAPMRVRAAMLAVLGRQKSVLATAPPRIIRVSLESRAALIIEQLQESGELNFGEHAGETRDSQIATFLACLTLSRQGRVQLQQDELFGPILVLAAQAVEVATA